MDSNLHLTGQSHVQDALYRPYSQQSWSPARPQQWQGRSNNSRYQNLHLAKVDSWRSYRNDATNLQSVAGSVSALDATAPAFIPAVPSSSRPNLYYRPYEPLRVSNGTTERLVTAATIDLPFNSAAVPGLGGETGDDKKSKKSQKSRGGIQPEPGKKSTSKHLLQQRLPTVLPSPEFMSRYPVRSNRGQADQPIPSIEVEKSSGTTFANALKELSEAHRITPRYTPRLTKSPEAPETTLEYRRSACKPPSTIPTPRKLLVVLDLNGTLLYRRKAGSTKKVHMRPGVTPFLDYLFANHTVMIYTSAMPQTAQAMVNQFLHPKHRNQLAAVWARDKLDLTQDQFYNRVQVYKKLDKVWRDSAVQKTAAPGTQWDQSNTILIDDSKEKALAQPHNLLQIPEYKPEDDPAKTVDKAAYSRAYATQQDIVRQLELKLEELRIQEDVSRLIKRWQEGTLCVPRLPGQQIVVEEAVDQKNPSASVEESGVRLTQTHLPTPESLEDLDNGGVRLHQLSCSDDIGRNRSGSVSSIDEQVFKDLLEGTGK